jgi:succinate dehydrogenase / fumarate reductase flavoprotein subunit
LFVIGEANYSDHGANRLGASALMQGLADGYFVLPYTVGHFLAGHGPSKAREDGAGFRKAEEDAGARTARLLGIGGKRSADTFHRALGKIMWEKCGMARHAAGLREALAQIPALREEFWSDLRIPGGGAQMNQDLERAGRIADYLELGELMCRDALQREESCGGHFREEHQTPDGEARRDDERFAHVSVWEFAGDGREPALHREPLAFEFVKLATRSYK